MASPLFCELQAQLADLTATSNALEIRRCFEPSGDWIHIASDPALLSLCRIQAELSQSGAKVNELAAEVLTLRKALDLANAARDSSTLRQHSQDAALASRDEALATLREQHAAAVAAHADESARNADTISRLEAQLAETEQQLEDVARASAAADRDALDKAAKASHATDALSRELKGVSAVLHDHLAAESEVAVWYLHTTSRHVASRDVAKVLAALLEETRSRLDEGSGSDRVGAESAGGGQNEQQHEHPQQTGVSRRKGCIVSARNSCLCHHGSLCTCTR